MNKCLILALPLAFLPLAAFALPEIGAHVGTTPEDASAALAAAGCTVDEFEAEDGMIEAKCHDAAGGRYEIYIDPTSGAVAKVKDHD